MKHITMSLLCATVKNLLEIMLKFLPRVLQKSGQNKTWLEQHINNVMIINVLLLPEAYM